MSRKPRPASKILRDVGQALYGPTWQSDLARALDVSDRTIRRWVAGDSAIPPSVADELLVLIKQRQGELADAEELVAAWDAASRRP